MTMKQEAKTAKFQVGDILPLSLTIVVAGIGMAYGLTVLGDVQSDMVTDTAGCNATDKSACGAEYNASGDAITAVAKFPEKLGLIVTVVVAAILIGILVRYLLFR